MGEPTEHEILQFVARGDAISPIWIKDIAVLQPCKYGMYFKACRSRRRVLIYIYGGLSLRF